MRLKIAAMSVLSEFGSSAIERTEYVITSVRMAIVDKLYGPEPPTLADRQRDAEHERLQRAFPSFEIDRKGEKR
jgi:hypothetical protein